MYLRLESLVRLLVLFLLILLIVITIRLLVRESCRSRTTTTTTRQQTVWIKAPETDNVSGAVSKFFFSPLLQFIY
jgi:hypothetical protein